MMNNIEANKNRYPKKGIATYSQKMLFIGIKILLWLYGQSYKICQKIL